mmetsp:Transcript_135383/g.234803  ORF Transcript_135383/g.234803 Transcript_135383/m.234803 type:complete len:241 (-) Transcript_135383:500-1222(-)
MVLSMGPGLCKKASELVKGNIKRDVIHTLLLVLNLTLPQTSRVYQLTEGLQAALCNFQGSLCPPWKPHSTRTSTTSRQTHALGQCLEAAHEAICYIGRRCGADSGKVFWGHLAVQVELSRLQRAAWDHTEPRDTLSSFPRTAELVTNPFLEAWNGCIHARGVGPPRVAADVCDPCPLVGWVSCPALHEADLGALGAGVSPNPVIVHVLQVVHLQLRLVHAPTADSDDTALRPWAFGEGWG